MKSVSFILFFRNLFHARRDVACRRVGVGVRFSRLVNKIVAVAVVALLPFFFGLASHASNFSEGKSELGGFNSGEIKTPAAVGGTPFMKGGIQIAAQSELGGFNSGEIETPAAVGGTPFTKGGRQIAALDEHSANSNLIVKLPALPPQTEYVLPDILKDKNIQLAQQGRGVNFPTVGTPCNFGAVGFCMGVWSNVEVPREVRCKDCGELVGSTRDGKYGRYDHTCQPSGGTLQENTRWAYENCRFIETNNGYSPSFLITTGILTQYPQVQIDVARSRRYTYFTSNWIYTGGGSNTRIYGGMVRILGSWPKANVKSAGFGSAANGNDFSAGLRMSVTRGSVQNQLTPIVGHAARDPWNYDSSIQDFNFQWQRTDQWNRANSWTDIPGATSSTYNIDPAHFNGRPYYIRFRAIGNSPEHHGLDAYRNQTWYSRHLSFGQIVMSRSANNVVLDEVEGHRNTADANNVYRGYAWELQVSDSQNGPWTLYAEAAGVVASNGHLENPSFAIAQNFNARYMRGQLAYHIDRIDGRNLGLRVLIHTAVQDVSNFYPGGIDPPCTSAQEGGFNGPCLGIQTVSNQRRLICRNCSSSGLEYYRVPREAGDYNEAIRLAVTPANRLSFSGTNPVINTHTYRNGGGTPFIVARMVIGGVSITTNLRRVLGIASGSSHVLELTGNNAGLFRPDINNFRDVFNDGNLIASNSFNYQWQRGVPNSAGGARWEDIPGATGFAFLPREANILYNTAIRVVMTDTATTRLDAIDNFTPVNRSGRVTSSFFAFTNLHPARITATYNSEKRELTVNGKFLEENLFAGEVPTFRLQSSEANVEGSFTDIPSIKFLRQLTGGSGRVYGLPDDYDERKNFFRAAIDYGQRAATTQQVIISLRTTTAPIETTFIRGTIDIRSSGIEAGDEQSIEFFDFTVNGRAIDSENIQDIQMRWQLGTDAFGGEWRTIANQNLQTYNLAREDFLVNVNALGQERSPTHLRAVIAGRFGDLSVTSSSVAIESKTTDTVTTTLIADSDAANSPNVSIAIDFRNYTDGNGLPSLDIAYRVIPFGVGAARVQHNGENIENSQTLRIAYAERVTIAVPLTAFILPNNVAIPQRYEVDIDVIRANVRDGLGISLFGTDAESIDFQVQTIIYSPTKPSGGALTWTGNTFTEGSLFTLTYSGLDAPNGFITKDYHILQRRGGGIRSSNNSHSRQTVFALNKNVVTPLPNVTGGEVDEDYLVGIVTLSGPFSRLHTLTASILINQQTEGAMLSYSNGLAVGSRLDVDISNITDANGVRGARIESYAWQNVSRTGAALSQPTYILTQDDIDDIGETNPPRVSLRVIDEYGFGNDVLLTIGQFDQAVVRIGRGRAEALVHPLITVQTYTWQNSDSLNGTYAAIANALNRDTYTIPNNYNYSRPFIRVSVDASYNDAALKIVAAGRELVGLTLVPIDVTRRITTSTPPSVGGTRRHLACETTVAGGGFQHVIVGLATLVAGAGSNIVLNDNTIDCSVGSPNPPPPTSSHPPLCAQLQSPSFGNINTNNRIVIASAGGGRTLAEQAQDCRVPSIGACSLYGYGFTNGRCEGAFTSVRTLTSNIKVPPAIISEGLAPGDTQSLDRSNLRDASGNVPLANALNYKWQVGVAGNNTWSDISGATSATYDLAKDDFNVTLDINGTDTRVSHLRVLAYSGAYTVTSALLLVNTLPSGELEGRMIADADGLVNTPNATVSLDLSKYVDGNGYGSVAVVYSISPYNRAGVSLGTFAQTMTMDYVDKDTHKFPIRAFVYDPAIARVINSFRVNARVDFRGLVDNMGYTIPKGATSGFADAAIYTIVMQGVGPRGGTVRLRTEDDFRAGTRVTATYADARSANGFLPSVVYRWQQGAGNDLTSGERNWFEIRPTLFLPSGDAYLNVEVTLRDIFSRALVLKNSIRINHPARGAALRYDGVLLAGTRITVSLGSVVDVNGTVSPPRALGYSWQNVGGSITDRSVYIMTQSDINHLRNNANAPIQPQVVIRYVDAYGFDNNITLTVGSFRIDVGTSRGQVQLTIDSALDVQEIKWEQSNSANGTYTPIANASASVYVVPRNFDFTKPFVRASLAYTFFGDNVVQRFVSPPTELVGVTGRIDVRSSGVMPGDVQTANISRLGGFFSDVATENPIRYSWQTGIRGVGFSWQNINNANETSYALVSTDFNASVNIAGTPTRPTHLRILASVGMFTVASEAVRIAYPLAGTFRIRPIPDASGRINAQPNTRYTVILDDLIDPNGLLPVTQYDATLYWLAGWIDGNGVTQILVSNDTSALSAYRVGFGSTLGTPSGMPNFFEFPPRRNLNVSIDVWIVSLDIAPDNFTAFDRMGYRRDTNLAFNASYTLQRTGDGPSIRVAEILADSGIGPNAPLTANVLVDSEDPIMNISYQWRFAGSPDGSPINPRHTGSAAQRVFNIPNDWGATAGRTSMYVVIQARDIFSRTDERTVGIRIAEPPTGVSLAYIGGVLSVGATITVDTDNLVDRNDGSAGRNTGPGTGYAWEDVLGTAPVGLNHQTYTISQGDYDRIRGVTSGDIPRVRFIYLDRVGYSHTTTLYFYDNAAEVSLKVGSDRRVTAVIDASGLHDVIYNWEQSDSAAGTYRRIPNASAGSVLVVPNRFDFNSPFVRVSVEYANSAGGTKLTILSDTVELAGLSGALTFDSGGRAAGDVQRVDLEALRNYFGDEPEVEDLSYQWQVQANRWRGGDNNAWFNLTATSAIYTLTAEDFGLLDSSNTSSRPTHLRVFASLGKSTVTAGRFQISEPFGGTVVLTPIGTGHGESPHVRYRLDISGATDPNGVNSLFINVNPFHFFQSNGLIDRSVGSCGPSCQISITLAPNTTDYEFSLPSRAFDNILSGRGFPALFSIDIGTFPVDKTRQFRDNLGYSIETALRNSILIRRVGTGPTGGVAEISGNARAREELTVTHSGVVSRNGVWRTNYIWEALNIDRPIFGSRHLTLRLQSTTSVYVVPPVWNTVYQFIRARVEVVDIFRRTLKITSKILTLNQPTSGGVVVESLSGRYVGGATLRANTGSLRDANGLGVITYDWQNVSGGVISQQDYVLSAEDITAINNAANNSTRPRVVVTYTDSLGFSKPFTTNIVPVAVDLVRDGVQLTAVLQDDNRAVPRRTLRYVWQRGTSRDSGYEDIVGADGVRASTYSVPINHPIGFPFIRSGISYTPTGGERFTLFSPAVRVNGLQSGIVSLSGNGLAEGARYTAVLNHVRDVLGRVPPSAAATYQWQTGTEAEANSRGWEDIRNANSSVYVIAADDFAEERNYLRVVIDDVNEYIATEPITLMSAAQNLSQDATGLQVRYIGGVRVGKTVRADVSNVTDANGTGGNSGATSYTWRNVSGSTTNARDYILSQQDIDDIKAGGSNAPQLQVVYRDQLGFVNTMFVTLQDGIGVNVSRNGVNVEGTINNQIGAIIERHQWVNSNAEDGTYIAIGGATNLNYVIDNTYNFNRPFLRLSLVYQDGVELVTIQSDAMELVALSGEVAIDSGGKAAGDTQTAVIDDLRGFFSGNAAPAANAVAYQWQVGLGSSGGVNDWRSIAGAVNATYDLVGSDFDVTLNGQRVSHLRLLVRDGAYRIVSPAVQIESDLTGTITLNVVANAAGQTAAPGIHFTLQADGLASDNGLPNNFKVQTHWQVVDWDGVTASVGGVPTISDVVLTQSQSGANSTERFPSSQLNSFAVDGSLINGFVSFDEDITGQRDEYVISITLTADDGAAGENAMGYRPSESFIASYTLTRDRRGPRDGEIMVAGDTYVADSEYTLSFESVSPNGTLAVYHQWYEGTDNVASRSAVAGATTNIFTLTAGWDKKKFFLYPAVTVVDIFSRTLAFTNTVLLNRSGAGAEYRYLGGLAVGNTVRVNVENITDANGVPSPLTGVTYLWTGLENINPSIPIGNLPTPFPRATRDYILTQKDVDKISADSGTKPIVYAFYTDGFGFRNAFAITLLDVIELTVSLDGTNLGAEFDNPLDERIIGHVWQNSDASDGTYTDISGATGLRYAVPRDYDFTRPYVRLSLDYGDVGAEMVLTSEVLELVGLSGEVAIDSDGKMAGDAQTANRANLREFFSGTSPPAANAVDYQWQVGLGNDGDANWGDINGATNPTYNLAKEDFEGMVNNERVNHIRLIVSKGSQRITSQVLRIQDSLMGTIGLTVVANDDGEENAPGVSFRLDGADLQDANGLPNNFKLESSWQVLAANNQVLRRSTSGAGTTERFPASQVASYSVDGDLIEGLLDFDASVSGARDRYVVSVTLSADDGAAGENGLGYRTDRILTASFTLSRTGDGPSGGTIVINNDGFGVGSIFDMAISDVTSENGTLALYRQWYDNTNSPIANATNAVYTLSADWDGTQKYLYAAATVVDIYSRSHTFTTSIALSKPASGLRVRYLGGVIAGRTVQADIEVVADANGTGGNARAISYRWLNVSGSPTDEQNYILTQQDIDDIKNGAYLPVLRVVYEDELGFANTMIANVQDGVEAAISRRGARLQAVLSNPITADIVRQGWISSDMQDGLYTALGGADQLIYTVPPSYDFTRSFVRLSLVYEINGGQVTITSSALELIGLSGEVAIDSAGQMVGDAQIANRTNLREFFSGDSVPAVDAVNYQWQVGLGGSDNRDSNWRDIRGANAEFYNLSPTDFDVVINSTRVTHLRLVVFSGGHRVTSQAVQIQSPLVGDIDLNVLPNTDGRFNAPGISLWVDASGLSSNNGLPANFKVESKWKVFDRNKDVLRESGAGAVERVVATEIGSIAIDGDLFNGFLDDDKSIRTARDSYVISISVSADDGVGGENPMGYRPSRIWTASYTLTREGSGPANGSNRIVGDTFNGNGNFTMIVNDVRSLNGTLAVYRQWLDDENNPIANATNNVYAVVPANWDKTKNYLYAAITVADLFSRKRMLTASVLLNKPTRGLRVEYIDGLAIGNTVRADLRNIVDENGTGAGVASYTWQNVSGSSTNTNQYIISQQDLMGIRAGGNSSPRLQVLYTDDFGFANTMVAVLQEGVMANITRNGANVRAVLDNGIGATITRQAWENSDVRNGTYTAIGGATALTYVVPSNYDFTRPFVRLSLVYEASGDVVTVISDSIQLIGLTGDVAINSNGLAVGSTQSVNRSNLRSLDNSVPSPNALGYQWQVGIEGNSSSWENINNATNVTYDLARSDFNVSVSNERVSHLRVLVSEGIYTITSPPVRVRRAPVGNLAVRVRPNSQGQTNAPAVVLSADASGIVDANGLGNLSYDVEFASYDASGTPVGTFTKSGVGVAGALYTLSPSFFADNATSYTIVYTGRPLADGLGYEDNAQFMAVHELRSEGVGPRGGSAVANGDAFVAGSQFTVTYSGINSANGLFLVGYQWQAVNDGRVEAAAGTSTEEEYTLSDSWNADYPSLRVLVTVRDIFARQHTITSAARAINQPTEGELFIDAVADGSFAANTTVRANIGSLTDNNGLGNVISYRWENVSGSTTDERDYILSDSDVAAILSGGGNTPPRLVIVYGDALGFMVTLTTNLRGVLSTRLQGAELVATIEDRGNRFRNQRIFWQRGTEDGVYTEIAGANGSRYFIPTNHSAATPFVRAGLSYDLNGANIISYSAPVRVAGLASGAVAMLGSGYIVGSQYDASLTDMLDVLGRVPQSNAVTYQWQSGSEESEISAGWRNINGATNSSYRLRAGDFENGRSWLRLVIADSSGHISSNVTLISAPRNIERAASGDVIVVGNSALAIGNVYYVDTRDYTDENGTLDYTYNWYRRLVGGELRALGTDENYTVEIADFGSGETEALEVSLAYTDAFGFAGSTSAELQLGQPSGGNAQNGQVIISASGNRITLGTEFSGGVSFPANGGVFAYEWGRLRSAENVAQNFESIGSTSPNYTLSGGWNIGYPYLALRVTYTDVFNVATDLYSDAFLINRPTEGEIVLQDSSGGELEQISVGLLVTANIRNLRDDNNAVGEGEVTDIWRTGQVRIGAGRDSYRFDREDVDMAMANGVLTLFVEYRDGVGFLSTLTLNVGGNLILEEVGTLKEVDGLLNVVNAQTALGALGGHLDNLGSSGGFGLDSSSNVAGNASTYNQSYLKINERRIDARQDILGALSSGNHANGHGISLGEGLAVNNFAVARVGEEWTAWAQGSWNGLSGMPLIGTNTVSYEGDALGLYGGYDKLIDKNVRLGLSAGHSRVNIMAALSAGNDMRDDKVERNINAMLPYMEWREDHSRVRLVLGYGMGDLSILENGGACAVNMDVDWKFGSIGGEYAFLGVNYEGLQMVVVGNMMYSTNSTAGGSCGSSMNIPASQASSGEWQFGSQLRYHRTLSGGYEYVHRLGLDARRALGDVHGDLAYDLSGGFSARGLTGFAMHVDGRLQIEGIDHERNSINGKLEYRGGGRWSSSLQSGFDDGGLLHRWEWDYQNDWLKNTVDFGVHVEQRFADDENTRFGGEVFIWF